MELFKIHMGIQSYIREKHKCELFGIRIYMCVTHICELCFSIHLQLYNHVKSIQLQFCR